MASGMRWKSFGTAGIKRVEENNKGDDKKFAVKLNQSGYKPDDIKVQLRGQELTVTVRHEQSARGPIKIATITLNSTNLKIFHWMLTPRRSSCMASIDQWMKTDLKIASSRKSSRSQMGSISGINSENRWKSFGTQGNQTSGRKQ